jgi:hypothetical protein
MACSTMNEVFSMLGAIRAELAAVRADQAAIRSEISGLREQLAATAAGLETAMVAAIEGVEERMDVLEEALRDDWVDEVARDVAATVTWQQMARHLEDWREAVDDRDEWSWIGMIWGVVSWLVGMARSPGSAVLLTYKCWYLPVSAARSIGLAVAFFLDPAVATIFVAALKYQERVRLPAEGFVARLVYSVFRRLVGGDGGAAAAVAQAAQRGDGGQSWFGELWQRLWGGRRPAEAAVQTP